jgi:predicted transcriptional regulator
MRKSMVFEGVAVTLLILLLFLMLAMILSSNSQNIVSGIGEVNYTYVGCNDTLYVFSGNTINAIGDDGKLLWTFNVPEQWSAYDYEADLYSNPAQYPATNSLSGFSQANPIVASSDGVLYIYLEPVNNGTPSFYINGTLMAISGGKELWSTPLVGHTSVELFDSYLSVDNYWLMGDVQIYAAGGNVYVFHDYNETVIGDTGSVLWNIGNVTDPAAVDENGYVYCVRSVGVSSSASSYPYNVYMPDYREPSGIIDAYYPNGTLYWESYPGDVMVRQPYYLQAGDTLPVYNDGMLYAPLSDGITALYLNGTIRWTRTFDPNTIKTEITPNYYDQLVGYGMATPLTGELQLYSSMPFDSMDDVYLQSESVLASTTSAEYYKMLLITITPDGQVLSKVYNSSLYTTAKNGIGYGDKNSLSSGVVNYYVPSNLTSLETDEIAAFNVSTGDGLWNYTFVAHNVTVTTLDTSNIRSLIESNIADEAISDAGMNISQRPHYSSTPIASQESLQISPGDNIVYACYQTMNYNNPIVLGQSKCAYYGGIYAFSLNGTLLWSKQLPPINPIGITNNGTIFYQTPDGKIGVTNTGIAATGFTLTILIYLFLRFFCIGAVARAKASLNKNEKRNQIYDYIVKNPGLTIYEIARGTRINMGTARYHVFILGMNHKIASYRTEGKYVRYFTNSNTFNRDEQLILSVMRREVIGRVLMLLAENPCMSITQISKELDIQESAVSRCIKELSEKGIITRESVGKKCLLDDVQREHINTAIKRMNGE